MITTAIPIQKTLRVLIGCERSGRVRDEFRKLGHDAISCDLSPSEVPGPHRQGDIFESLQESWDVIILHPPCTCIALCGNSTYGRGMPKHASRISALAWTESLWNKSRECSRHVGLENPKAVLGSRIGKRSQKIQPYQFGHPEQKETWLWLYGLPPLRETKNVYADMMKLPKKERERIHYMSPSAQRGVERSRTFTGIAKAMAEQWSAFCVSQTEEHLSPLFLPNSVP